MTLCAELGGVFRLNLGRHGRAGQVDSGHIVYHLSFQLPAHGALLPMSRATLLVGIDLILCITAGNCQSFPL